uniref:Insulin like peptide n=1 Tax=Carabus violaceus TaxID=41075 RepID=A0A7U3RBS2_CARVO|nr:insulin like peptide [Carabus violaceus]
MLHKYSAVIILVTCICFLIQAQSEVYQIAEKKNTRVYCGSTLSDMLSMVCQGRYNTKFHKKSSYAIESDSDEDYGYVQQQQPYLEDTMLQFPYRTRANAASLISGTFRRYTRGIIDECCRKPCSIKEMRSYCAPDV